MLKATPAKPNELQIDLDTDLAYETFKQQLKFLRRTRQLEIISVRKFTSRSGNRHVSITLTQNLPIMERIALQAALGSDVRREMCNWGRARNNAPYPIILIHRRPRS